jgi:hypothetical protein
MCAIWHTISYTVYGHGVKFGIRCACPLDSFKTDMDSLKMDLVRKLSYPFTPLHIPPLPWQSRIQRPSLISKPPPKQGWVKLGRGMIVVLGPLSATALGSS